MFRTSKVKVSILFSGLSALAQQIGRDCIDFVPTMHLNIPELLASSSPLTEAERVHLNQLLHTSNNEISRLTAAIDKLVLEREKLQSNVAVYKAILAPIRLLPEDMLREIFVNCLPSNKAAATTIKDAPLLLGRICHSWRELALSTPDLWASIHVQISHQFDSSRVKRLCDEAHAWISRSGTCPLTIGVTCSNRDSVANNFLNSLTKLSKRWRSIDITAPADSMPSLVSLSKSDLPRLERFRHSAVTNTPWKEEDRQIFETLWQSLGILGGERLRDVSLQDPQLRDPLSATSKINFGQLTRLYLDAGPRFTLMNAADILGRSPNLIGCSLLSISIPQSANVAWRFKPLTLAHLTSFAIHLAETHSNETLLAVDVVLDGFFSSLDLPQLISFSPILGLGYSSWITLACASRIENLTLALADLRRQSVLEYLRTSIYLKRLRLSTYIPWTPGDAPAIMLGPPMDQFMAIDNANGVICPFLEVLELPKFGFPEKILVKLVKQRAALRNSEGKSRLKVVHANFHNCGRGLQFDVVSQLDELVTSGTVHTIEILAIGRIPKFNCDVEHVNTKRICVRREGRYQKTGAKPTLFSKIPNEVAIFQEACTDELESVKGHKPKRMTAARSLKRLVTTLFHEFDGALIVCFEIHFNSRALKFKVSILFSGLSALAELIGRDCINFVLTMHLNIPELLASTLLPTEAERAYLNQLLGTSNDEISRLTTAIDKLVLEREKLQSNVAVYKAILAPIRLLPEDMLREIFVNCLPSNKPAAIAITDAPLLLGRICHSWRELALSTPELWASIHVQFSLQLDSLRVQRLCDEAHVWIARSGTCPLTIALTFENGDPTAENFVDSLTKLSKRWRSIDIEAPVDWMPSLISLSKSDVPRLERFRHSITQYTQDTSQFEELWHSLGIFDGEKLCDVSLQNPWLRNSLSATSTVNFGQLTRLDFDEADTALTLMEVADILGRSPNLITCHLKITEVLESTDVAWRFEPVTLLHLTSFTIGITLSFHSHTSSVDVGLRAFFSSLDLPKLTSFSPSLESYISWITLARASPVESLTLTISDLSHQSVLEYLRTSTYLKRLRFSTNPIWNRDPPAIVMGPEMEQFMAIDNADDVICPFLEVLELTNFLFSDGIFVELVKRRAALKNGEGKPRLKVVRANFDFRGGLQFDVLSQLDELMASGLSISISYHRFMKSEDMAFMLKYYTCDIFFKSRRPDTQTSATLNR
ncbi:hypothetical protein C8J56DRAFT_885906 [Mycena floridula]|nr:hypothetical protein C8J56DRAFT_885906 [Mycena floridula]